MPKRKEKKFQAHSNEGICIQHSPCGSFLITAGDNQVKSWKEDFYGGGDFVQKNSLGGLPKNVNSMCFYGNSKYFAISSLDFKIRIVNLDSMKISQVLTGHQDLVSGISFLRRDFLVSGGADRVIKVWDVQKGKTMNSVR